MTNNQLIQLILSRLGKRQGNDYLQDVVLSEIQLFLDQLEKTQEELPWFLEAVDERALTPNQFYLDLQSDFLKEVEETSMILTDPDSGAVSECVKRIPAVVRARIAACSASIPNCYAIEGNRWLFAPKPIKAYRISIPYGRKSSIVLANDVEVTDWALHATQAVSHTVQEIVAGEHLQDDAMAAKYTRIALTAWKQFKDYANARKYTNLQISSGDDE